MPRLSLPSIRVLVRAKPLKDGSFPLCLQVNYKGQSEYRLSITVPSLTSFDKNRQRIKSSVPNSKKLNEEIVSVLNRVEDYRRKLDDSGVEYTHRSLLDCLRGGSSSSSSSDVPVHSVPLISEVFGSFIVGKRDGSMRQYNTVVNHLKKCFGGDVEFRSLAGCGDKVISYVANMGWADSYARIFYALFNAVWDYALDEGIVDVPFPVSKRVTKRFNRNGRRMQFLNESQLDYLEERYLFSCLRNAANVYCSDKVSSGTSHMRPDFLYSDEEIIKRGSRSWVLGLAAIMIRLSGLAPIDMGYFRLEDLHDRGTYWHIYGNRKKTGYPFNFTLSKNSINNALLLPYIRTAHLRNGLLFNILRFDGEKTVVDLSDEVSVAGKLRTFGNLINEKLRDIWKEFNKEFERRGMLLIPENTPFYGMRHSYASKYLAHSDNLLGLATTMGKSVSGLSQYVHAIQEESVLVGINKKIGF